MLQGKALSDAFFWSDLDLDRRDILVCAQDDGGAATQAVWQRVKSLATGTRITAVVEDEQGRAALENLPCAPEVAWVVTPFHHLSPLPAASMDLVILAQALGKGPVRMLRILREAHRVLRPGGRVVIRQGLLGRGMVWWQRQDRLLRLTEHLAHEAVQTPVELDELSLALELVGFSNVRSGQFIGEPVTPEQWSQTVQIISQRGTRFPQARWRTMIGEELKELFELLSSQGAQDRPFYIVHAMK